MKLGQILKYNLNISSMQCLYTVSGEKTIVHNVTIILKFVELCFCLLLTLLISWT